MNWENKVKMVQLGNRMYQSEEVKKEFQEFVLSNVETFDGQSWDMFCNLSNLVPDEMKLDVVYWKKIYQYIKEVDCNSESFGLRTRMRVALIQTICEDEM